MSVVSTPPVRTLEEWIDAMLTADPQETRQIAMDALKPEGCALADLVCDRHGVTLRWIGLHRHLHETGPHNRGEVRPRTPADRPAAPPWSTSTCRSCGARVVWALTPAGKQMPVDAEPSPAGHMILVASERETDQPHVLILHTESERAEVEPGQLRTSHLTTCPSRGRSNR